MFDKAIKLAHAALLAALVLIIGWFCWTRRDVGRFTFTSSPDGSLHTVFDNRTGAVYMLMGKDKWGWVEMQPQTGIYVMHGVETQDERRNREISDRLKEVLKHPKEK